jgi:hypothetical protein
MPGFFANIPVLSALPNPLNLFNDDVPSQQDNNTPTTPTPILATESEISTQQHRKTSGTSVVIADDVESDSPRLGRTNGRRPRGLSVTSGVSGADSANGRKAKRRVDVSCQSFEP